LKSPLRGIGSIAIKKSIANIVILLVLKISLISRTLKVDIDIKGSEQSDHAM